MRIVQATLVGLLALLAALSAPASATPPTVIEVLEEPVGVSETHLFVLRVSTDNLGYYEAVRVEMYLIARDWKTGEEDATLIDRFMNSSDYSDEGEILGYSIKRDEGVEPANLQTLITDRGGMPWIAAQRPSDASDHARVENGTEDIRIPMVDRAAPKITRAEIQRQLDRQRLFLAANVADHPRSSTMSTRQHFEERRVSAEHCRFEKMLQFWIPRRSEYPLLMQLRCDEYPEDGITSLVVQLETDEEQDQ